jgi:ribosomal-protein-alanine N-acetyltransferase
VSAEAERVLREAGAAVRSLQPGDAPLLAGLERICFPEDAWSQGSFERLLRSDTVQGWLMEAKGEPAGYLVGFVVADEAELANMAVLPPWRGRGLGDALLRLWLERLRAEGAADVWLEVRTSNDAARALYGKHGFRRAGVRRNYYGNGEDAVVMHLALKGAPGQGNGEGVADR